MADTGLNHQMREGHPPFCAETSITIYLQDCGMAGINEVYCRSLTTEQVLAALKEAVSAVEKYLSTNNQLLLKSDSPLV